MARNPAFGVPYSGLRCGFRGHRGRAYGLGRGRFLGTCALHAKTLLRTYVLQKLHGAKSVNKIGKKKSRKQNIACGTENPPAACVLHGNKSWCSRREDLYYVQGGSLVSIVDYCRRWDTPSGLLRQVM